jgi:hypothetical protein
MNIRAVERLPHFSAAFVFSEFCWSRWEKGC